MTLHYMKLLFILIIVGFVVNFIIKIFTAYFEYKKDVMTKNYIRKWIKEDNEKFFKKDKGANK